MKLHNKPHNKLHKNYTRTTQENLKSGSRKLCDNSKTFVGNTEKTIQDYLTVLNKNAENGKKVQ